jgi:DNA-directed RNA polymerase subunit RPC12/RpoP
MAKQPKTSQIAAGTTACPECGAPLSVSATRQQGAIRVVYHTCRANPEHRFRSDERPLADSDPAAYCPTCRAKNLPTTTDDLCRRYRCTACGRRFHLPLMEPAR